MNLIKAKRALVSIVLIMSTSAFAVTPAEILLRLCAKSPLRPSYDLIKHDFDHGDYTDSNLEKNDSDLVAFCKLIEDLKSRTLALSEKVAKLRRKVAACEGSKDSVASQIRKSLPEEPSQSHPKPNTKSDNAGDGN